MSNLVRNPRPGCVSVVPTPRGTKYELTELGLAQILEMATLGSSPDEIAEYLNVSEDWIKGKLDEENGDDRAVAAFKSGYSEFKKRLRTAQANLADVNATMSIWMGKQHLGQKDAQQIDITKTIRVVGTMPDYEMKPDEWARSFAPEALQPKQIEQEVEEAQIVPPEVKK